MRLLITGAAGYLGSKLLERLTTESCDDTGLDTAAPDDTAPDDTAVLVATDIRVPSPEQRRPGVVYRPLDVRDPKLADVVQEYAIDTVVHLAAVVNPGPESRREEEYSIDVGGTENVLEACRLHGVRRLVVTSSGAAYGYHADNPEWLSEEHPLRGNAAFPYAHHKRLVEALLARHRDEHPALGQVVLRLGTVLGAGTQNQITHLFDKPRLLGIRGGDDRFVFIWDEDVAACLEHAVRSSVTGIFNVAGDGALSMGELARRMGKPHISLPAPLVRLALSIAKPLRLSRYGPEQVRFVQYRPVLDNTRLKRDFGFTPSKTSSEVFDLFWSARCGAV